MKIINPATEQLIEEITEDTDHSIADKFLLLRQGQPRWAAMPLAKRIACITRFY